jgi:type I restriction enzyme M protein
MSEKRTEEFLYQLLKDKSFEDQYIFRSPTEHSKLKHIFSKASKTGNGIGIPDRIYFDGHHLIIFECKKSDLNKALNDLILYREKMIDYDMYQVFFVAVAGELYDVFDVYLQKINLVLDINNFKDIRNDTYTNQQMDKDLHKIHNYIRDYTKISNEDKSFFIACILISLTKASFSEIIKNYNTKRYLYDIIKQNLLELEIDISVFEFLRNDENNVHFYNIITMVKSIYDKNPGKDLLNYFYSEFVKYNNTDGKGLGIVLTPDHIVKLMVQMLDINSEDVVLDLCTGTGSFLLEASKYNPKKLIGCEYQTKLYSLLKCNFILRGLSLETNTLLKGDCFDHEFKATKSLINPPYGMKDKRELEFVLKQLESVDEGGLVCAIIPCSKLSSNPNNNNLKQKLLQLGELETLIICNQKLFYPNAGVSTGIILLKKTSSAPMEQKVRIINYEHDGFELQKHRGMTKSELYDDLFIKILRELKTEKTTPIKVTDDWLKSKVAEDDVVNLSEFELKLFEHDLYIRKKQYNSFVKDVRVKINFKSFRIGDLFKLTTGRSLIKNSRDGIYPLISSSSLNNGIVKYVNTFSFQDCITVANSGSVCSAFYQEGEFECTSHVTVLYDPIKEINDKNILLFICTLLEKFKSVYNFGLAWSMQRMKKDELKLPVNEEGELDFSLLNTLQKIENNNLKKYS